MANLSGVNKYFAVAKEGFVTTTSSPVASGATTVQLTSVAGYSNGDTVVLVIDADDVNKKQAFTGVVDTGGSQIINVVWTEGANTSHILGAPVIDYVTASHQSMGTKGLLVSHNQDGTLKAGAVDNAAVLATDVVETAKIKDGAVTAKKMSLGASSAYTDTYETTISSSYTSLTTSTSVTLNVNTAVLIIIAASASNSVSAGFSLISFEASGANTIAASDSNSAEVVINPVPSNGYRFGISFSRVLTGLTPGSTTFSMRFKAVGGTAGFSRRSISVVPIG